MSCWCREKMIPKLLLSREEVHFCEVSRRRTALVSLLAHHSLLLVHAGRHCEFRAQKTLPPKRWQGQVPNSRFLFPEEEVRERLRIRASHAGHVIPALLCVKAVIGAE
jgi:hypothetical protein